MEGGRGQEGPCLKEVAMICFHFPSWASSLYSAWVSFSCFLESGRDSPRCQFANRNHIRL